MYTLFMGEVMDFKVRAILICGVSSLSLLSAPAFAQSSQSEEGEAAAAVAATEESAATEPGTGEIVVSATRQDQLLSKVPVSITAFDTESMEVVGAKRIDDLVRLTPGLDLDRGATGSNRISIRGISSSAGAGTTGIYIDDTPIQVRNLGYGSGTAYPEIFDLERVEVLRGPQGTLFGAGSEGGTVRFIQASPNMNAWSAYARGEIATTHEGDESYEGGVAVGGPILEDRIGFRAHVYFRKEGGYVDAVRGTVIPALDPVTGAPPAPVYPYANLVDFTRTELVREDTNSTDALTARLAVEFRPNDWLTLTPSVSYQRLRSDDGGDAFWVASSDIDRNDFSRRINFQGDPASNPLFTQVDLPEEELSEDSFYLYALNAAVDLGKAELISSTSYFDRTSETWLDFTFIDAFQFAFEFFVPEGYKSMSRYGVGQKNFVQEVRLQSTDTASRFNWVVGAFYSDSNQTSTQDIGNNFVRNLPFLPLFGGAANGQPFGPGSSAIENAFGLPVLGATNSTYFESRDLTERQYAGFGQADYEIVDGLTLIAGVRVSRNELELDSIFRGPLNNDNAPYGAPCPSGQTCQVGSGVFAPVYPDTTGFTTAETAVTPKIGVSWQATADNLFYGTVAKGFRPAGVNSRVPTNFCGPDLTEIGYVDASGRPVQPEVYGSDSVWSYELGSKNRLFDSRVNIDFSAYHIEWSNIQNSIGLPTCLYSFVDNLGNATSKGVDLALDFEPVDNVLIGGTVGYNKSTYDDDVLTPSGIILSEAGSSIGGSRPWRLSGYAQYDADRYYARADVSHFTEANGFGATDPDSPQFNPRLRPPEAYTLVNMRAGVRLGDVDASIFVENLTNAAPILSLAEQFNQVVYTATTLRPRTVGLTVSWRR